MSELQIGVLILGGGVIALVVGFNVFQEWRFRKRTQQAFARAHDDVLLGVPKNNVRDGVRADRMEPVLVDAELEPEDDEPMFEPQLPEQTPFVREQALPPRQEPAAQQLDVPVIDEEDEAELAMDSADHQALVVAMLDPSLDFIAEVVFHEPHELAAMPRFNVGKRTQLIGRTERGLWKVAEALPGTRYKQINISMQMVDRSGAVTEQELAAFCQQVSRFAEDHDAAVSFPQRQQKLVAARELDRFCADVDVLIGINIVPKSSIEGARLRSFVEAAGLQLEPDGAFHYLADSGNTLYSLVAADQMPFTFHTLLDKSFPALTLLFDVPRVAGGVDVFDRAVYFARQLAQEFDAQLVDDNRRVLSETGLTRIRDQLLHIYGSMDDRGIAPGSVAALRLFA
ncbi:MULTISPECIES: cell division protein ZipA C-terminal FtsZ-binding domain-containing protein [Chromobacterium]|uniref:Cell division protein ZipA n=2 Tax=Chromobacterium TaxID=535 RepID=A0ABV0H439_9NEIS|nr:MULTISPECIES: cell division protein ZipA C-terminal FtsZ-binding domain-containing protein [Chromobacterium]AVG14577.1 cell division protein FtsZ [Chromobacterium vaccinii]MBX9295321.1 cell division protein ZipA C-terminal FtsZ-binding domain-containing protein [Chromobacterium vaccinii]MBX9349885.1 cell division protein ZipA C-terminal FtsZ-binding domain-containing protein [Chromobacterium vaccinii]MBX9357328.1 cell division protein ZipA C-terminal FtsZ-binding domain-containing protein [C